MNCRFLLSLGLTLLFLIVIGGGVILLVGFPLFAPTAYVQGKITYITRQAASNRNVSNCYEIVQFSPNKKQSLETDNYTNDGECDNAKVGDVVTVAYHTDYPPDAIVVPPGGFLFGNLGLIIILIVGLSLGVFITAAFLIVGPE